MTMELRHKEKSWKFLGLRGVLSWFNAGKRDADSQRNSRYADTISTRPATCHSILVIQQIRCKYQLINAAIKFTLNKNI
ncbi:hypothetical protein [Nitrosomonas aestuarii]|nr:hypothetical protein [Nitrosomonas aestuarii]